MAISLPRRKARPDEPEKGLIGDELTQVSGCPICGRPLNIGAGRCPACGTRLLLNVPASRAAILLGIGAVVGMLFSGIAVGMWAQSMRAAAAAAAVATPAVVTPAPVYNAPKPLVPASAVAALRQAMASDARIAETASELRTLNESSPSDATGIAIALRQLSSDASVAKDGLFGMANWSTGRELRDELAEFYEEVRSTASSGLSISVTNQSAYHSAANRILSVIDRLAAVDAKVRAALDTASGTMDNTSATPAN